MRKVLSPVRAHSEQRDLAFLLCEREQANKFFAGQHMGRRMGITADMLTRDLQASQRYWGIEQDALADLVRIILLRCYDQEQSLTLCRHCCDLCGEVWLCALPNFLSMAAPAEWRYTWPYTLEPYMNCIFAGAYLMALQMHFLVRCVCFSCQGEWDTGTSRCLSGS